MPGVGYVVNQLTLKIGATQYETAVLDVEEVASPSVQTRTMASGDVVVDAGVTTWTLRVHANIDVATSSLWRILTAATNGSTATYEFVPDPSGNPTIKRTGTVVLLPPGGKFTPGEFAEFTVDLPIVGQPTTT